MDKVLWAFVYYTFAFWCYQLIFKKTENSAKNYFQGVFILTIIYFFMFFSSCFGDLIFCDKCDRLNLNQVDSLERYYINTLKDIEIQEEILLEICEYHKYDKEDAFITALFSFIASAPCKDPKIIAFTVAVAFIGDYYKSSNSCHRVAKKHLANISYLVYEAMRAADMLKANRAMCAKCEKMYKLQYWNPITYYLILSTNDIVWELTHYDRGCFHAEHQTYKFAGDE